jgi:hypothetical protein
MYEIPEDLQLCACMGPQGNEPHCPCKMRRMGLDSPASKWTQADIDALKSVFTRIFDKRATRL